ncbi:hypothetical protein SSS_00933 [Sarcoptes scabiei]|uniref:Uncharacterized protein n=1 Tax=Sarcoptes scabiei TaxID=52283 RepID=A0A834VAP7_SARSC|nr:hypothetical protein SSS_00933 [Sarcoptes scabiei]
MIDSENITSEIEKELDIGVLPQFIGREELCINKILKRKKFKYNPDLNGILIRYENMEIISDTGRIIDDSPYIFWKIRAKFHIFNVRKNQLISTKIDRICSKYIGSNYAKCIDIIIKFENDQIENEIKRLVNSGNLRVESEIIFKVKSFQPSQQYLEGLIDDEILNNLKAITSNH